jgi:hypothetical protein
MGGFSTVAVHPRSIWEYTPRKLTEYPVFKRLCFSGADGDVAYTPDTPTTYFFPRPVMFYRNLVIGRHATLRPTDPVQVICVSETLRLDGVIDASGRGGAGGAGAKITGGGGNGGAGGGGLVIIANRITGTGSILANGLDGENAHGGHIPPANGHPGTSGLFRGISLGAGGGGTGHIAGGAGGVNPKNIRFLLLHDDFFFKEIDGYGAGGGGGGSDGSTSANAGSGGGGGGAGVWGSGGRGADNPTNVASDVGSSGGGGGGGGLVVIMSRSPVPQLTIRARGGRGGNGLSDGTGGGGGGGGLIVIIVPEDYSTKDVSGGAGGAGSASGERGEDGLVLFIPVDPFEVI